MKYEARYQHGGGSFTRIITASHHGDLEEVLNIALYETSGGLRLVGLREAHPTYEVTIMRTNGKRVNSFRQEDTRADAVKHAIDAVSYEDDDDIDIVSIDIARVRVEFGWKKCDKHTATWKATE